MTTKQRLYAIVRQIEEVGISEDEPNNAAIDTYLCQAEWYVTEAAKLLKEETNVPTSATRSVLG